MFGRFGDTKAVGNLRQLPLLSPLALPSLSPFLFGLHGRRVPGLPAEHTTDKDSDGENSDTVLSLKLNAFVCVFPNCLS